MSKKYKISKYYRVYLLYTSHHHNSVENIKLFKSYDTEDEAVQWILQEGLETAYGIMTIYRKIAR